MSTSPRAREDKAYVPLPQLECQADTATRNTINERPGVEFHECRKRKGIPMVADDSSPSFRARWTGEIRPTIYAGAKKNICPAGLTIVIVRDY